MFEFVKKRIFPIGVDLGSGYLKMSQLALDGRCLYLHAAGYEAKPDDIVYGSGDWQRWAAKTAKELANRGGFKGKEVITAIPSDAVFIEQIKVPKSAGENLEKVAFKDIELKLPFDPTDAMVKCVVAEQQGGNGQLDVVVMAAERIKVDRILAIYEKADFKVRTMSVSPLAITNSYVQFFGRRKEDSKTIVMLVDTGANHSNIAICKHANLLFARVIPVGFMRLVDDGNMAEDLIEEMNACWRYFESVPGGGRIERLIFFSGRGTDNHLCKKVGQLAEKMQIPAQIADVLAAVEAGKECKIAIGRCGYKVDWARAFGLSLTKV